MAVATARTSLFGGADATFATAASPGAALTALFTAVDTALVAAGWTKIFTGTNENLYSSNGESGTETLFMRVATAGFGTVSGATIIGGSYLIAGMCQYADSSGNYYNAYGFARVSSAAGGLTNTCLALEASLTWHYAIVADKNGIFIVTSPTTSHANNPFFLNTGLLGRPQGINAVNLVTSSTINAAGGANIAVNVSANPITAGYQIGDPVIVVAQNAGGSGRLADLFATRISALTTTSVTLDFVPTLSANIVSGALIGEDPQPIFGCHQTLTAIGQQPWATNNGLAKLPPPTFPYLNTANPSNPNAVANLWSTWQQETTGDRVANNSNCWIGSANMLGGGNSDAATRPDGRTNSYFVDTPYGRDATSSGIINRGKPLTRCYESTRNAFSASLTVTYARRYAATGEEYVGIESTAMACEVWFGPFSVTNSLTKTLSILTAHPVSIGSGEVNPFDNAPTSDAYETTATGEAGVWEITSDFDKQCGMTVELEALDQGPVASSDDVQPVLIDQPYPLDYTYAPSNQESSGFNRGFN
jgi:hypothetical protein